MSNSKISPETQKDLAAIWLNLDTEYKITKAQKYRTFRQKYFSLHPTFFMQLHTNYLNFIHFITKNAIAATAVCLIALTAVSASAAQLVAPTEYKPSTIASNFFANKQTDKNPYTALKPDENNDVVISDKCDLAIKYPKMFDGKNVAVEKNLLNWLGDKTITENADDLLIRPQQSLENPYVYYSTPEIFCNDKKPEGLEIDLTKPQDDQSVAPIGKERKDLDVDFVKQEFGWFITQNADAKFRIYQNPNLPNEYKIYFTFKNKHYLVTASNQDSDGKNVEQNIIKALKGNQIQLQFNSLVKNEANKEIVQKVGSQNSTQNSQNNSQDKDGFQIVKLKYIGSMPGGGMCSQQFENLENAKTYFVECANVEKFKKTNPKMFEKDSQFEIKVKTEIVKTSNAEFWEIKEMKEFKFLDNSQKSSNSFTNEEFIMAGAGQMRYKNDSSGGRELKRVKDGQVYVLMDSVLRSIKSDLDFDALNDGKIKNLTLSAEFEKLEQNDDFAGGFGNAKFIITKLTEVKSKNTSNSPFTLSGKGCEPFGMMDEKTGLKCEIMENGKSIQVLRTCGKDLCFSRLQTEIQNGDYQYYSEYAGSNGGDLDGLVIYPFNTKTKKLESKINLNFPCLDTLQISSGDGSATLEYKTCFESEKMKKYIADYTKYFGTKPQLEQPKVVNSDDKNSKNIYSISKNNTENSSSLEVEKDGKVYLITVKTKGGKLDEAFRLNTKANWCSKVEMIGSFVPNNGSGVDKRINFIFTELNQFDITDKTSCPNSTATTGKIQSYTNQFYPSLKINYDNSWKMETITKAVSYKNLLKREIILTKNNAKLVFTLHPSAATGCSGGDPEYYLKIAKIGNKDIWRQKPKIESEYNIPNEYIYDKEFPCHINFIIKTNLLTKDNPDYYRPQDTLVEYNTTVMVNSDNENLLKEADAIVANSSFGTPIK